jgi:hypothetical protein
MKPAAVASLVFYTAGFPVAFLAILIRYRREIFLDQTLRQQHKGTDPDTNPHFHIRRRYQELYVLSSDGP